MRYVIPSIDNSREDYKYTIRIVLDGWEELDIPAVNGNNIDEVERKLKHHGSPNIKYAAKWGQLGRWLTFLDHLDASEEEPLFVVEDDAVLHPKFIEKVEPLLKDVPVDADFFSLFIPRNRENQVYVDRGDRFIQHLVIRPDFYVGHDVIVRSHQPYGGVAMFLYPGFKEKINTILTNEGICGQFDDVIYEKANDFMLNGYSIVPDFPDLAWIVANIPSTVHETGFYNE